MPENRGNALTGYATAPTRPDLPRATGKRPTHRPWCTDCKRTHDATDLNTDGRCAKCAHATITRAAAAARRAEAEAAEKAAARASKLPTEEKPGKPTPRRSAPRQESASSTTRRARVAGPSTTKKPAAARETRPAAAAGTPTRSGPERIQLPEDAVAKAYAAGQTLTQIGATYGVSHMTVARTLDDAGIARRGARVPITDDLAETVRRLYVDEGLTQVEVATRLGHSSKVIQRVMDARKIPTRPAVARIGADRAGHLKKQAADLAARGITVRDVKEWAIRQGLLGAITKGMPTQAIFTAFTKAHPAGDVDPVETTVRCAAAALLALHAPEATMLARQLVAGDTVDLGPLRLTLAKEAS